MKESRPGGQDASPEVLTLAFRGKFRHLEGRTVRVPNTCLFPFCRAMALVTAPHCLGVQNLQAHGTFEHPLILLQMHHASKCTARVKAPPLRAPAGLSAHAVMTYIQTVCDCLLLTLVSLILGWWRCLSSPHSLILAVFQSIKMMTHRNLLKPFQYQQQAQLLQSLKSQVMQSKA